LQGKDRPHRQSSAGCTSCRRSPTRPCFPPTPLLPPPTRSFRLIRGPSLHLVVSRYSRLGAARSQLYDSTNCSRKMFMRILLEKTATVLRAGTRRMLRM
jgi:hypothetical protein